MLLDLPMVLGGMGILGTLNGRRFDAYLASHGYRAIQDGVDHDHD